MNTNRVVTQVLKQKLKTRVVKVEAINKSCIPYTVYCIVYCKLQYILITMILTKLRVYLHSVVRNKSSTVLGKGRKLMINVTVSKVLTLYKST